MGECKESSSDTLDVSHVIDDLFSDLSPTSIREIAELSFCSSGAELSLVTREFNRLRDENDELTRVNAEYSIRIKQLNEHVEEMKNEISRLSGQLVLAKKRCAKEVKRHSRELEEVRKTERVSRNLALKEQAVMYCNQKEDLESKSRVLREEFAEEKRISESRAVMLETSKTEVMDLSTKLRDCLQHERELKDQVMKLHGRLREFKVPSPSVFEDVDETEKPLTYMIPGQLLSVFRSSISSA
jgi:hypothetical protein